MQCPRGTRDLFGDELARVRYVGRVMASVFQRYGYQEVETPVFESLELFTKKSGADVVKQIYAFKDKSGRKLALRPELTAPVVRLYNEQLKSAPKPLKLFYFGRCFRYERPQVERGRWRQFLQAGAELIGSPRAEADAEVAALTSDLARGLGLKKYELRVGNIRLLRETLRQAGVDGVNQDPIMRAIDSRDEKRLRDELKRAKVKEKDAELLRSIISLRGSRDVLDDAEKLVGKISEAKRAVENLREIIERLEQLGVRDFKIDLGIARGLEYYTDFVFELYAGGVQLGGGGRYDELIELLGGEPCPAVGVGFGVDRIARALKEQRVEIPKERLDCMVLPAKREVLDEALDIAKELRQAGISVDVDLMGRSLSKGISYADARGARYAAVVGPEDLKAGKITLRDMGSGEQRKVAREKLAGELSSG